MVSVCHYAWFSHLTYQKPDFSDLQSLGYQLPEGWKVVGISSPSIMEEIKSDGYFGIAFKRGQNLVFAHRGSVLNIDDPLHLIRSTSTIINDASLFLDDIEFTQFKAAKHFINKILSQFHGINNIKYSFTGHSLGAAIGEISSVYYGKKAILFDNPGAKNIIDRDGYMRYEHIDITSYQSAPNFINDCCNKYGKTIKLFDKQYTFNGDVFDLFTEIIGDYFDTSTHELEYIMKQLGCDIPDDLMTI